MRNSQWRRHRREVAIQRVERWMRNRGLRVGGTTSTEESLAIYKDWARRRHAARASCSGPCCGNPRTHFKEVTTAERRAADSAAQEVIEAGIANPHIRH